MSDFSNGSQTYNGLCRPVGLAVSRMECLRMSILNCMQIFIVIIITVKYYCYYRTTQFSS